MARAEENHLDPLYLHFAGLGRGTPVDGGGGCTPQCDTAAMSWGQVVLVLSLPGAHQ